MVSHTYHMQAKKGGGFLVSPMASYPAHPSLSFLLSILTLLGIDASVLCLAGKCSITEVSLSPALSGEGKVFTEFLKLALNLVCSPSRS